MWVNPQYLPQHLPNVWVNPTVPPKPRKVKSVEYHESGSVKRVEYED
jgi:hypothetical protein